MEEISNIKEVQALISLVDDPDKEVFKQVTDKISRYGQEIIPYLEAAWCNTFDPLIQKRIENLIHNIHFDNMQTDLKYWLEEDNKDILQGWMIVARYQYPELNEDDIKLEINRIRKEIWLELNDDLTALEQVKVFNHIFFNVIGFKGAVNDQNNSLNFIKDVLETKKGNTLSLGLVYMLVAQSLDMPVYGINFPNHFILAYSSNTIIQYGISDENEKILFYINPFSNGNAFSYQEAEWFLQQMDVKPAPQFFKPCLPNNIIMRVLHSIFENYEKQKELDKAKEIETLINIVKNYT